MQSKNFPVKKSSTFSTMFSTFGTDYTADSHFCWGIFISFNKSTVKNSYGSKFANEQNSKPLKQQLQIRGKVHTYNIIS
ncbi:MAG TPA: hypothetical protein DEP27_01580 [Ruminococcaceae bacterium]|jgi:hypothetical protein|nr:hypothetical protein [Oscillospiraceae bacterium]